MYVSETVVGVGKKTIPVKPHKLYHLMRYDMVTGKFEIAVLSEVIGFTSQTKI